MPKPSDSRSVVYASLCRGPLKSVFTLVKASSHSTKLPLPPMRHTKPSSWDSWIQSDRLVGSIDNLRHTPGGVTAR
eukprot:6993987-Pyramimonas_sp.AAC.2